MHPHLLALPTPPVHHCPWGTYKGHPQYSSMMLTEGTQYNQVMVIWAQACQFWTTKCGSEIMWNKQTRCHKMFLSVLLHNIFKPHLTYLDFVGLSTATTTIYSTWSSVSPLNKYSPPSSQHLQYIHPTMISYDLSISILLQIACVSIHMPVVNIPIYSLFLIYLSLLLFW